MSLRPLMLLPKRFYLVDETARVLREGIVSGEWLSRLPGERSLCERLQVSRATLRNALQRLEREGLVSAGAGRIRKVRQPGARKYVATSHEIGLLSIEPVSRQSPQATYFFHELREQLQAAGFRLQIFSDLRLAGRHPEKLLDGLLRETRVAAWLLMSLPVAVQRWFEARRVPTLVAGACHEGVRLPSFGVNLRAACRHAAGVLRAHGHSRIALLRQPLDSAGMKASEEGFFAGVRLPGKEPGQPALIGHDATPEGIRLSLDRALASGHPPTGLVVCGAAHAICAASHLLLRQFSLPGDLSLICRDHDDTLPFFAPRITCYAYRKSLFARRLSRLAIQLALRGHLPARNYRLIPQIVPGRTVAAPPAA